MSELRDKFLVKRNAEIYSDFMSNMDLNPVTGFLAKVTNEDAVKQSIRNLILTTRSERFQRSDIGSKIKSLLFDPVDTVTEELLRTTITETIKNNEPRANVLGVRVEGDSEYNAYYITIFFEIINIPSTQFDLNLVLRRIR